MSVRSQVNLSSELDNLPCHSFLATALQVCRSVIQAYRRSRESEEGVESVECAALRMEMRAFWQHTHTYTGPSLTLSSKSMRPSELLSLESGDIPRFKLARFDSLIARINLALKLRLILNPITLHWNTSGRNVYLLLATWLALPSSLIFRSNDGKNLVLTFSQNFLLFCRKRWPQASISGGNPAICGS